ncbi:hypothetical protein E2C01_009144 [Portunus trituberculatus]|uniref:Uncharacterized protein n=1 Tax=Portunus trituberculatus TaxID=210409 RepID=A0A5B7D2P9_PORTR|nr:hypothetical protein [Portunus trituberculatus]
MKRKRRERVKISEERYCLRFPVYLLLLYTKSPPQLHLSSALSESLVLMLMLVGTKRGRKSEPSALIILSTRDLLPLKRNNTLLKNLSMGGLGQEIT